MFGFLPARGLSDDAVTEILQRIENSETGDNPRIAAGYTYLGQFIDHDVTFDPTSQLQKVNDPYALVDFRTPRLDLDSLYGSGPDDQPFLYDWASAQDRAVKLLVDRNVRGRSAIPDLPRNGQGRALLGDPRNDENLILAQLHLLFIRFHNKVVDHVRIQAKERGEPPLRGPDLLREAQRIVRWHYQWIVVHDFLPRIVGEATTRSVLVHDVTAPAVRRRFYRWRHGPFIPVEFSGAAYRFGHSMVRGDYTLRDPDAAAVAIFVRGADPHALDHLGGFRRLPPELEIAWSRFFDLPGEVPAQRSLAIDSGIALGLRNLPPEVHEEPILPRLNMRRARALALPAGTDVARAMNETPLTEAQLLFNRSPKALRPELMRTVPLWYYVLREAKALHDGHHLGPVGGRIVAEVLLGLLEGDASSYLRQWPAWRPELPPNDGEFTMSDLVRFTNASA